MKYITTSVFISLAAVALAAGNRVEDDGPWGQRVEVVASIVGYCKGARLPTGEVITQIVPSAEDAPFDATGFLFCILSPAEYEGRPFKVHHDGLLAAGDPYTEFDASVRYRIMVPMSLIGFPDAGCSMHAGLFPKDRSRIRVSEQPKDVPALLEVLRMREQTVLEHVKVASKAFADEKTLRPDSKHTIRRLERELLLREERSRFIARRISNLKLMIADPAAEKREPDKSPQHNGGIGPATLDGTSPPRPALSSEKAARPQSPRG